MLRLSLVLPAVLVLTLSGCSHPPKQGIVISTEYNRAHYDEYMYCGAYSTTMSNGVSYTSCTVWLIGQTWVPDAWSLRLKDGKHTGWRGVPQSVYDGPCGKLGASYPKCAA